MTSQRLDHRYVQHVSAKYKVDLVICRLDNDWLSRLEKDEEGLGNRDKIMNQIENANSPSLQGVTSAIARHCVAPQTPFKQPIHINTNKLEIEGSLYNVFLIHKLFCLIEWVFPFN